MTYLLAQAPRKSLGSLGLEQLVTLIQGTDVRLSLPLQTVEKLKDVSVAVQQPRCLLFCLLTALPRRRSSSSTRTTTAPSAWRS